MLMEPDEYTSQERALTDKAKELIEQHELDWGNGECFIQRDAGRSELYMTLEAPNHATVSVTVPAEADEKGLRRAMGGRAPRLRPRRGVRRMLVPRSSRQRNGIHALPASCPAFRKTKRISVSDLRRCFIRQSNETIAEIRWTEEDLRHWLKDHDWPDNNENMDAMRDMISAKELRDRSIEEGWEIIDAMVDDGRLARKDEGEKAETSETYDPANPGRPVEHCRYVCLSRSHTIKDPSEGASSWPD